MKFVIKALFIFLVLSLSLAPIVASLIVPILQDDSHSLVQTFTSVLSEARQWRLFGRSVGIALCAAVLSGVLGIVPGYALSRMGAVWRSTLVYLLALPLVLPPFVLAIAWTDLLGRNGAIGRFFSQPLEGPASMGVYSVFGVILVFSLTYFPVVAFCTCLGLRRNAGHLEEAALQLGGPVAMLRRITGPAMVAGTGLGMCMVFVVTLLSYAVPSLLQTPVYVVEIYTRLSAVGDAGEAAAQGLPLLILGIVGLFLLSRPIATQLDSITQPHKPRSVHFLPTGPRRVILSLLFSIVALLALLPLFLLAYRSAAPSSLWEAWGTAKEEWALSFIFSALAALFATILGYGMALYSNGRFHWLHGAGALALLCTGPIFALGVMALWNRPGMAGWVYDRPVILVVACVGHYWLCAALPALLAVRATPADCMEAAKNLGASPFYCWRSIALPHHVPWLLGGWCIVFLLSFGDLDTVLLIAPPGYTPLSVRLFSLMHYGPSTLVSALSLLCCVLILGSLAVVQVLRRIFFRH